MCPFTVPLCLFQALGQSSRQLLDCASERARVLELLPHSGSAGGHRSAAQTFTKTDPVSPFTPGTLRTKSQTVANPAEKAPLKEKKYKTTKVHKSTQNNTVILYTSNVDVCVYINNTQTEINCKKK